ncbi:MAG: hypothetical protein LBT26_07475 [Clostridiales Family XIII bacterium]|jgi:hypothetical protein|nr:hypothetical protein [Clostridiales Family XIII bacterium]
MLYSISTEKEKPIIAPLPFVGYGLEKDLENLIAEQIAELFVEDGALMTIFQERPWQEEPDICALDRDGNLVIFELKRGAVSPDAVLQIIRYAQSLTQKTYAELNSMYRKYSGDAEADLVFAHKEALNLSEPLTTDHFNRKQKLILVGNGADASLVKVIDYWKGVGLDIDFIPYRLYQIGDKTYFEFFTKPYDFHLSPEEPRGILFDTNRTYSQNAVWDMIKGNKVSAYGGVNYFVDRLHKGDIVLFYHSGVIAAGEVLSEETFFVEANEDEAYRKIKFISPLPASQEDIDTRCVSAGEITELTGKSFYWASTVKAPYLSQKEAMTIVEALGQKYK